MRTVITGWLGLFFSCFFFLFMSCFFSISPSLAVRMLLRYKAEPFGHDANPLVSSNLVQLGFSSLKKKEMKKKNYLVWEKQCRDCNQNFRLGRMDEKIKRTASSAAISSVETPGSFFFLLCGGASQYLRIATVSVRLEWLPGIPPGMTMYRAVFVEVEIYIRFGERLQSRKRAPTANERVSPQREIENGALYRESVEERRVFNNIRSARYSTRFENRKLVPHQFHTATPVPIYAPG